MQFLLHEVASRIFALFLLAGSVRKLRTSLERREITYVYGYDTIEWLLGWDKDHFSVFNRDVAPFRYWLVMTYEIVLACACVYVVFHGWYHPKPHPAMGAE